VPSWLAKDFEKKTATFEILTKVLPIPIQEKIDFFLLRGVQNHFFSFVASLCMILFIFGYVTDINTAL
jgi:hypothetical protein